jgi:apolipoprotein N-acyltransferase
VAEAAAARRRLFALVALALLAGGVQAWSMAPVARGWLEVLSVAALLALVSAAPPSRAWLVGGAFGVGWLGGTFWWLFTSMYRYGHLPAWLAALAVALLAALLSVYLALAMALFVRWKRDHIVPDFLLWSALWLLAELARAQIFTGFPWGAAGYAHVDGPLAALAPWIGVYGIGAVAAGLGLLVQRGLATPGVVPRLGAVAVTGALVLLPAWTGGDFTRARSGLSVTLLQGNVPQDEKFEFSRLPATLDWHIKALLASKADLVIAPETAIPLLPSQLPPGLWDGLQRHFAQGRTRALIGVPLGDADQGYTNSVAGLGTGAGPAFYHYDKHHLVPFGEFIPPGFRWFVDMMQMPLGDFARGPLVAPSFTVGAERVGPNICYEDLFGEELAARFVDTAAAPTMLANVSNIGWFGESVAVDQHLLISRMRTLELQRPMVRATNTGATVAIDHRGVVTHRLAPHVRGVLEAQVQGREGVTPFAWWAGRLGLWPLWGIGLLGVVLARRRG